MHIIYNLHKTNDSEYFREYQEIFVQFLLRKILARNNLIISIDKTVPFAEMEHNFCFLQHEMWHVRTGSDETCVRYYELRRQCLLGDGDMQMGPST